MFFESESHFDAKSPVRFRDDARWTRSASGVYRVVVANRFLLGLRRPVGERQREARAVKGHKPLGIGDTHHIFGAEPVEAPVPHLDRAGNSLFEHVRIAGVHAEDGVHVVVIYPYFASAYILGASSSYT